MKRKKNAKKLRLSRETLRSLKRPQLGNAVGGRETLGSCQSACPCRTSYMESDECQGLA
jgi:hypothetical protein